ncbi:hypothetical protein MMC12_000450 [Toensbergia leucococca]|nr:hypothetical protein [Toensbergia leucococca]
MAELKTLHLVHLPAALAVHVVIYRHLKNAAFIRQQLLTGNVAFEYALIDASVITSTTHVLAAVFRAANDMANKRLKSHNVHSEIVFALSPNNNIAESFRRFGIADTTTDVLVIKLSLSPDITHKSVEEHLRSSIEGTPVEFCDETLAQLVDPAKVRKIYKLNAAAAAAKPASKKRGGVVSDLQSDQLEGKELEYAILGMMALRGAS